MKSTVRILFLAALAAAIAGCINVKVNLLPGAEPLVEQLISGEGNDKVVLIDLSGVISSADDGSLLGGAKSPGMLSRVREELDKARADKDVKAVVLRVNSPGGGVTASDTLYHEIKRFKKETGVKVVAHVLDVGASGAYYASLAADHINAQPTSIVGSIGVTMLRIDATGLMQKVGVQAHQISSGEWKSMGSPFRPLSPEERDIFQNMIDNLFRQFARVVADERNMPLERVRQVGDGRVFSSAEAKNNGLIDDIGYLEDSIQKAMSLANISQARVVDYARPGEYRPNIYSTSLININLGELARPGVSFAYVWMP